MNRLALRIPPVVVVILFAVLMWYVARNLSFFSLTSEFNRVLYLFLTGCGLILIFLCSIIFFRFRTTLNPLRPELTTALVTSGLYRFSRNPIYVGFVLILLGWGFYLRNPASLLCVFGFILYMNRFQIEPEEKSLERKFGDEFERYKRNVNRWL